MFLSRCPSCAYTVLSASLKFSLPLYVLLPPPFLRFFFCLFSVSYLSIFHLFLYLLIFPRRFFHLNLLSFAASFSICLFDSLSIFLSVYLPVSFCQYVCLSLPLLLHCVSTLNPNRLISEFSVFVDAHPSLVY